MTIGNCKTVTFSNASTECCADPAELDTGCGGLGSVGGTGVVSLLVWDSLGVRGFVSRKGSGFCVASGEGIVCGDTKAFFCKGCRELVTIRLPLPVVGELSEESDCVADRSGLLVAGLFVVSSLVIAVFTSNLLAILRSLNAITRPVPSRSASSNTSFLSNRLSFLAITTSVCVTGSVFDGLVFLTCLVAGCFVVFFGDFLLAVVLVITSPLEL